MIRFILIALLLVLFLLFMIPVMLVLLCISLGNKRLSSAWGQGIVRGIFRVMLAIAGTQVEVRGLENIPKEGGVLFVSNHRSYFDILIAYAYTPKLLGFIAKSEMLRYPLLKQWMDIVNCLFLDREDLKKGLKTILEAIEKIKQGVSVWICPEGTRIEKEDDSYVAEFKEGSFKIAEKSGALIVPVALSGTRNIFEKQFPRIRAVKVCITYLEPIDIAQLDKESRKKLGEYTRARIAENIVPRT